MIELVSWWWWWRWVRFGIGWGGDHTGHSFPGDYRFVLNDFRILQNRLRRDHRHHHHFDIVWAGSVIVRHILVVESCWFCYYWFRGGQIIIAADITGIENGGRGRFCLHTGFQNHFMLLGAAIHWIRPTIQLFVEVGAQMIDFILNRGQRLSVVIFRFVDACVVRSWWDFQTRLV